MKIIKFFNILFLFIPLNIFAFIDYNYTSNLISIRTPLLPILENDDDFYKFSLSVKNIFSLQYERFVIDGEEWEASFTNHKKISNRYFVGTTISYKLQTGGILDPFIEAFHRSFNITQQYRDIHPRNKIFISYEPNGQLYQLYDFTPYTKELRRKLRNYPRDGYQPPLFLPLNIITSPKASYFIQNQIPFPLEIIAKENNNYDGLDNPKVYALYQIKENFRNKLYIGINTKVPVINKTNYFYSSGFDTSLFLSGKSYLKNKTELLYGISYTYYELKKWDWIRMPDHQWSFRIQSNYYYNIDTFFIEYLFISRPILNVGRLAEDSHFLTFGIKKNYVDKIYTFSIIENLYLYATSPDVGFYFSVQYSIN